MAFLQAPSDFVRQRRLANKRLQNLRRQLNITTKDTKNYKNKEKVTKISQIDYEKDARYGEILLFTCERDLLFAEEVKLESDFNADSKSSKQFIITKYKKAYMNGVKLFNVVDDENVKLQLAVYITLISGNLELLRRNWEVSLKSLCISHCALQFLNKLQPSALYEELIEVKIDPLLKLCYFQLEKEVPIDLASSCRAALGSPFGKIAQWVVEYVSKTDGEFFKVEPAGSDEFVRRVKWSAYETEVKNSDIQQSLFKVSKLLELSKFHNVNEFDPILLCWQDLVEKQREIVSKKSDADEDLQDNQILLAYCEYNYLLFRVARDLQVVRELKNATLDNSKLKKRLFDNVSSTLNQIKDLPGVYQDEALWSSLETLIVCIEALEMASVGECMFSLNKYKESLALYSEAEKKVSGISFAKELLHGCLLPNNEFLKELSNELKGKVSKTHVLTQYFISAKPEAMPKSLMGMFQPVHVKPVLFDIGFNYIHYTEGSASEEKEKEIESRDSKKGFFGLFGGR